MTQLQIGDKIKVKSALGDIWICEITRVTKTQAIGKHPTNDKWNPKFKREIKDLRYIQPIPKLKWDQTKYELIKEK